MLCLLGFEKRQGRKYALCQCHCGTTKAIRFDHIKSGNTSSCGCFAQENGRQQLTRHGQYYTPLYELWKNVRKHSCDWQSFEDFATDVSFHDSMEFVRLDTSQPYSKDNCTWMTPQDAIIHRATKYTYKGESLTLTQWAEKTGIARTTLKRRLQRGWSLQDTLTIPARIGRNQFCSEDYYDYQPRRCPQQTRNIREWKPWYDCKTSPAYEK